MPVEMALWKIKDEKLHSVASKPLNSEEMLEDWLADDISMVSEDLLVIGRQVSSDLGGVLDLLAIDQNGDLAVLELKRHLTPRDVVAQALHYAAWVRTLTWEDIEQIASDFYDGASLAKKFSDQFGESLPENINTAHQIYIVAAEMDSVSETIVRYLSEEYGVNINVVFFRHFCDADGNQYLGHSWLIEPSEVQAREVSRTRRSVLTLEQLKDIARENGAADQYAALFEFFSDRAHISRTQSNVAFVFNLEEGRRSVFSVYPGRSSAQEGLCTDVRPDLLASVFGVNEAAVQAALPEKPDRASERGFTYGEVHYFRSAEQVRELINVLLGGEKPVDE